MSTSDDTIIQLKAWTDEILGVDELVIQSPSGRKIRIQPDNRHIEALPAPERAIWETVYTFILNAINMRVVYEKTERYRLRQLADQRGKTWVYELPEYQDHIKMLNFLYPPFTGVVNVALTKSQMALLHKISQL